MTEETAVIDGVVYRDGKMLPPPPNTPDFDRDPLARAQVWLLFECRSEAD